MKSTLGGCARHDCVILPYVAIETMDVGGFHGIDMDASCSGRGSYLAAQQRAMA